MRLREWRQTQKYSLTEMANRTGFGNSMTWWRYEVGEHRVDAPVVERIVAVTNGQVTAQDMHEVRLEWLKANKPDALLPVAQEVRA